MACWFDGRGLLWSATRNTHFYTHLPNLTLDSRERKIPVAISSNEYNLQKLQCWRNVQPLIYLRQMRYKNTWLLFFSAAVQRKRMRYDDLWSLSGGSIDSWILGTCMQVLSDELLHAQDEICLLPCSITRKRSYPLWSSRSGSPEKLGLWPLTMWATTTATTTTLMIARSTSLAGVSHKEMRLWAPAQCPSVR